MQRLSPPIDTMTTDTRRKSVSNALAKFEANIAKSGDTQCMSFLTNVASNKKKIALGQRRLSAGVGNSVKTGAGAQLTGSIGSISKETNSTVTSSPWESPPASPSKKHQSSRILTAVQQFEKAVSTPHVSPKKQSVKVNRLAVRPPLEEEDPSHTSDKSRNPRPQPQTNYEYDYKETQKVWQTRTGKQRNGEYGKHRSAKEHKQQWSPKQLKKRRLLLQQQSLAQRMPKRGSMGLVGTVSQKFKPQDLYPGVHEHQLDRRSSGLRAFNSTCSTQDTRSNHRRTRRRRKTNEAKLPPARRNKPKRRNSTGCVRFSEEPIVTIYWNPAGQDEDEDDLAQSTWRHDEHARCTEDYRNISLSERQEDQRGGNTVYSLERKGLIQRRKSTGCSRFTEEPTHWLYGREDHEIVQADIPSTQKKAEAKKAREQGLRKPCRKASMTPEEVIREEMKHAEEAVRKGREAANRAALDHPQGIVMLKQAIPVHEDSPPNTPLRRVERRGSTGAVPLAEEPESRLHRKQKIRRELKRSNGLRRERQSVFRRASPSPNSPRKASVMGLLDPLSNLPETFMDPRRFLMGAEDYVCASAPSYVQRKPSFPTLEALDSKSLNTNPNGALIFDEIDEDSDIDNSGHSIKLNGSIEGGLPVLQIDGVRPITTGSLSSPQERSSPEKSENQGAACCTTRPATKDGAPLTKLRSGRAKHAVSKKLSKASVSAEAKNDVCPKGWGFSIVEPGYKVARYVDKKDGNRIKTEVKTGSIPQKAKAEPRARKAAIKNQSMVQEPIEDGNDDSSTSSFDSSSSTTDSVVSATPVEIPKGTQTAASGDPSSPRRFDQKTDPDVTIPHGSLVRVNTGKSKDEPIDLSSRSDKTDDDTSCSSNNTFAERKSTFTEPLLRPGVMRGLSFENDMELVRVLENLQRLPSGDRPIRGRRRTQSRPNTEIDKEILLAVEKAATKNESELPETSIQEVIGHPAAHMIKTVAKMEREGKKKDKKKKREREKKTPKKEKSKDTSLKKGDRSSVEERRKHRTTKAKVTRKESSDWETKKEKVSNREHCSDKHGVKEHTDKRSNSSRPVQSPSGKT
eukprot:scaffold4743_cov171-Amphora_coffeaeformis.AAC.14